MLGGSEWRLPRERAKEYPVSDAKPGDVSPKRPGMNAEEPDSGAANSDPNQTKGKRRRRKNKRARPPDNGVQADNATSTASTADSHPQSRAPDNADSTVVATSKSSKRRRRRRGKRGKGDTGGQDRQNAQGGNGAPHSNSPFNGAGESAGNSGVGGTDHRHNAGRGAGQHLTPNRRPDQQLDSAHSADRNTNGQSPTADTQAPRQDRRRGYDKRRNRRRVPKGQFENNRPQGSDPQPVAPNNPQTPDRGKQGHKRRPQRRHADAYAALDLGTNNCRLLVAVPQQPGRFKVVDAFSRIVRLGEGLAATGKLGDEAMDRAIGALKACAGKLENRKVRGVRLIATEACRRASNGTEFLTRVEQQAGIKLEIIDRETEARLAVAGCSSLVDRRAKGVVLFDIGGGSSELALLDLSKRKRHDLGPAMVSWTSLPLGVVTLSEKHGGGKLVTRSVFEDMVADVSEMLAKFDGRDSLQEAGQNGEIHLLGTSGTVTTLAGIHLKLPRYDRRQVDGIWMASQDVDAMINQLVDMSFEQRVANPCIGRDRADLVLAGCAILVAIQQLWPCPRLRVADRGLREGLLTEMMNADNAWQRRPKYFRQNRN